MCFGFLKISKSASLPEVPVDGRLDAVESDSFVDDRFVVLVQFAVPDPRFEGAGLDFLDVDSD